MWIIINYDLKKVGKSCSTMSSAVFRTGLRAPHVVLAGAMVAGTALVTPGIKLIGSGGSEK